jgi:hypothetical protein
MLFNQHKRVSRPALAAFSLALICSIALQQRIAWGQQDFAVKAQDAAPHFPETIDFTLNATGFTAERAELNFSVLGESTTSGLTADLNEPTDTVETSVTLDLRTSYIPPGAQVTYYWKLTSPDGKTVDTPAKTFEMEDEGYNWRTLTDDKQRVRVHWYRGSSGFGHELLTAASDALNRLESQVSAGLPRRAEIWIYKDGEDLFDALPLHQPEWVGGQAYPDKGVILAAIADDEYADLEIKRTIPHEISHLVLYHAAKNPYNVPPAWLDEGLAVHNQDTPIPGSEESLQEAAEGGWLVPIKALSGSFGADEEAALLAYAESGSVVDFILSDPRYGHEKLAATVAAFKDGVTYDDALKAGLGITVDQLNEQWLDSLPYKVAPPGSAPRPVTQPNRLPGWLEPLMYVAVGIFVVLFLVGGVVTLLVFGNRGMKRKA